MPGGIAQILIGCERQKLITTIGVNTTTADYGAGFTMADMSTAVVNGRTVTDIGAYSASAFTFSVKILKRNSAGNFDVAVSESLVHGGTGIEYKQLSTQFIIPASGTYYLAAYASSVRDVTTLGVAARAFLAGDQAVAAGVGGWTEDTGGSVIPLSYKYLA